MNWDNYEWINVEDSRPTIRANVLFVVKSKDPAYHGRIMVGRYAGNRLGYHGFTIPGIEFEGSHWGVLPQPPAEDEEGQALRTTSTMPKPCPECGGREDTHCIHFHGHVPTEDTAIIEQGGTASA
jgi:hypothetical protein